MFNHCSYQKSVIKLTNKRVFITQGRIRIDYGLPMRDDYNNFIEKCMRLELLFKILVVVFVAIAAFFLWQGNQEALFVSAVLAAVSFFLNVRFQFAERKKQRQTENQLIDEDGETGEQ